ncbi:hypothetical protein [Actinopolymorpha pittospori]|uniref:Uncharacterized protein n=1 Tax=Actinopolymorpha pittospori TaxID=648752 RepID=A0A927MQ81_9ACTN|nr:hypothetical protein [Actinopolymorpha pittospori]MBE1604881.1 hypothetical protein [Actinopolymorpha pittospori]
MASDALGELGHLLVPGRQFLTTAGAEQNREAVNAHSRGAGTAGLFGMGRVHRADVAREMLGFTAVGA